MNYSDARSYLLNKPLAIETFPFGPDVAVMKVQGKMFATLAMNDGVANMNLKCDPHEALILRDMFESVIPGYHMNKLHWDTVILNGTVPDGEVKRMIDNSFLLVVDTLTKAKQQSVRVHLP